MYIIYIIETPFKNFVNVDALRNVNEIGDPCDTFVCPHTKKCWLKPEVKI